MKHALLIGFLIGSVVPQALVAQRLGEAPARWVPGAAMASASSTPALVKTGDYRAEGTVVGGVLLGAAGL